MSKEEVHDLLGIISFLTHTKLESREGASKKPGRIRGVDAAKNSAHHLDLANKLLAASGETSNDIRVTADELCSRVHNNISTPLVRLAEDWTTEGVVDDEKAVVLLGDTRSSLEIGHSDGGVGRGLDIDHLALTLTLGDGSFHLSLRRAGVESVRGNAEGRKDSAHEHLGATVYGVREAHVITGVEESETSGGDSTHTTAHEASSFSLVIPDGDLVLEDLEVRIANTAVDQGRDLTLLGLPETISDLKSCLALFSILEHEC